MADIRRLLSSVERIAEALERLADHFAPPPTDIVGTSYLAHRLACTQVWITDRICQGDIPKSCIVPGTGNGKVWKLYRRKIDKWIESRWWQNTATQNGPNWIQARSGHNWIQTRRTKKAISCCGLWLSEYTPVGSNH